MAELPNDIPGNSLKSQQQQQQEPKDNRPPVPVFQGESGQARRKEHKFLKWCRKMFLSDRKPKDILMEIVEYRIIPGIKDNMRNSAMATIDSFIYPNSGPSGPSTSQNGINYNRMFNNGSVPAPTPQSQQSTQKEENKGFNNPTFRTQSDAMTFLGIMKNYDYPTLSVHTLYMMLQKHIDYTWDAYGWNREEILALNQSCIRHINGNPEWPWMISLPEAHIIS